MPIADLEKLKPVERAFQVVSALKAETVSEEDRPVLQAWLDRMLAFQKQSYFLGIHPSWLEVLVAPESRAIQDAFKARHPVLMQVLKTKLKRMSQQEGLLETGQRELSAYLVKVGRAKTALLLAKQPEEIQSALIAELAKTAPESSSEFELDFMFEFNYSNSSELFKQAGFYCKDPGQVIELAQRMDYAQGQKLIKLLTQ